MNTLLLATQSRWTFSDRPTLNLLLRCISPETDSQTVQQIKTLAQGQIDWQSLVQIAKAHRVMPLLYNRLSTACPQTVPASLLNELRYYCKNIAIRNLSTTAELRRLLLLMKSQGIDTLPYKGPMLTQMLYGDLELRQFGDLDIVIQPEDMRSVEKLLMAEGYRPYFGEKTATELDAYMKSKNEHTYDFYHDHKKVFLEIHWRFWPVFFSSVTPKDIWHRRESAELAGKIVSNFKVEDYLIILCMHGSRHQWNRLSWLCDIALLLQKYPNLDWQQMFELSEQWGAKRMLRLGLYLACAWLQAPLPDAIAEKISADPAVVALATRVDNQIFGMDKPSVRFMGKARYHLRARERWQDKALYAQSFIHWLLRGLPSEHHTT
jgi:hypothetical protein